LKSGAKVKPNLPLCSIFTHFLTKIYQHFVKCADYQNVINKYFIFRDAFFLQVEKINLNFNEEAHYPEIILRMRLDDVIFSG